MANKIADFMFQRGGIPRFEKFLDLTSFRHKLISGNMANVSTPGFQSRDIDFDAEIKRLTGESNRVAGSVPPQAHIPTGIHKQASPDIEKAKVADGDLNSGDVDKEISNLAQNEILFTVGAQLLKQRFDGLRKVITSK